MVGKIIKSAKSLKGKHSLVLKEDDYLINGVQHYSIVNFENGSLRGSFDAGMDKNIALKQLEKDIIDWNKYNTKLGKLRKVI